MKKVCHISSVHGRNDARIFLKECCSLAKAGYEVSFLCADNQPDEVINNVRINSITFNPRNRIARMLGASKAMINSALSINADIYHFHDPELLPVGLVLKKRGKKVIYDSHEDVPRQILSKPWIPLPLRTVVAWIFEQYENFAIQRLDHVIAATPYIERRFNDICAHKATAISNYPLLNEFDNKTQWSQKQMACCYIGGITQLRGIEQIVSAIGLLQIKLYLCGRFEAKGFERALSKLEGFKFVEYLGVLDREGIQKVLQQSRIGLVTLLPTKNHLNSFPVKMFEYMAAGIPVIASEFPLWQNIVEENECGICVDPYDIRAIADTIHLLIRDDQMAKRMGMNGRRAVEEKYNWGLEEEKLLKLYKEI